jgi:methionyl-tRNA synthetase
MSKSIGNVVAPQDYIKRFGLDALRYFVYREMSFGQDADFADQAFLTRYNADLANDLGNLVSRATTMVHRYCGGTVPAADRALLERGPERKLALLTDNVIQSTVVESIPSRGPAWLGSCQLGEQLRAIWEIVAETNRYIVAREPWTLAKDAARRPELDTALYVAADAVRVVAELLRPFLPGTAERTLKMLGVEAAPQSWKTLARGALTPGARLDETVPLFPRIEQTVEELRQMADDTTPSTPPPAPASTGAHGSAGPPAPAHPGTPAPAPASPSAPDRISIDDFMKVELRVAKVLAAERVPKSKKLLKLNVDVGTEQRTIVAGIAEAYEPESLVGRTVVIVFNLQPAKLMGVESNGMVLAASPDGGKPTIVGFDEPPAPGTRVR